MKRKLTILLVLCFAAALQAQVPEKMSYQAVIRDSGDELVKNTQVGMRISILQGSATGTAVYTETQTPTTNANGLVSIQFGGGAGFSAIDWSSGVYFLKTETDINGGTNYSITGTSQLLSVPYALYAKTAGNVSTNILANLEARIAALEAFTSSLLYVGMPYKGGVIAYIDSTGQHGLIAAPSDQSTGIQWYNGSYITTSATGTTIGTGQSNTTAIIAAQGAGSYAAKLCEDLVLNGYNDWFLPSKDELNMLYQNKDLIGGFSSDVYWSSSDYYHDYAWYQFFNSGIPYYTTKDNTYRVRAVRYF